MSKQVEGEAPCVTELRESRLNTYREMPNDVSSHYNDEGENEENYYGRFAYELIQNADDAVGKTDDPENPRKARFELHTGEEPCLVVANTGPAVDAADTRALTTIGDTTKRDADRKATIGHKGRGFSAVLEITDQPCVFSTDVSFMFDRERSRECIASVIDESTDWNMADIAGIPLMRLPFAPDRRPERVEKLLQDGYQTVFYFPLHADAVKGVRQSLTELDEQTVLFLQNLQQLEVVAEGGTTTWEVARQNSSLDTTHSAIDMVKIRRNGNQDETTKYLRFVRDAVSIGEHTAGISNNTWGEVSETRVSVAVRVDSRDDGIHLQPVMADPQVHVFLPTEERSPVPLLINGAFDSNLSRTALDLTPDDQDYNRFLIREAANIIASDVAAVARRTATTAPEFLSCLDFTTWADPESRDPNTVRDEVIRAIQAEFADVECVPVGGQDGTPRYVKPPETIIPSILAAARGPLVDFVGQWGGTRVELETVANECTGYFPDPQLLEAENSDVPSILSTLGAQSFPVAELPTLLPALPDEWFRINQYPPGPQRTATDPVVNLVAAVWTHLDEEGQDRFGMAARNQPLIPVAVADDGTVTRVSAADTELYLPPEDGNLAVDIPEIRFVLEYVYRPRGRLGSKALPQAVQHCQSVIKQVWRPDNFEFEELVRTTVTPRLSETSKEERDEAVELQLLSVLHDLGTETANPDAPLPLQDRYETQPLYRLCQLPVPTQTQGWCPAYRVYFGDDWLAADQPASAEKLFEAADIDAPMLLSPDDLKDRLTAVGIEFTDGLDVTSWRTFMRWLGVAPHLRLRSFFAPDEQRRFSDTVAKGGVQRPSNGGSVLGKLDQERWEAYRTELEGALDEMDAGRQRCDSIYRVNDFEYWDAIHRAARQETDTMSIGQALVDHLISWWKPVFSDHRDAVLATHNVSGFGNRNSSSQSKNELREVGTNLWLWQLQTSRWCPTTRGAVAPGEAWDPPAQQSNPFSLGEHSLLPILYRNLDPVTHEAQPLFEELGIRHHLSAETFTPSDARTVCEGLADVCRSNRVEIAESLREIQPVYRQIQDLSPPVDEPLPEDSEWQGAPSVLGDCPILCRVGKSFDFIEAEKAYFARSPSTRADYPFDHLPFFILEEQRAARLGEYFGLHDFTEAVSVDGEPIDRRDDQTKTLKAHLEECAAAILCRLEAERPSQRLIEQDLTRMRAVLDRVTVVDKIEVTYTLDPIGDEETLVTTTSTEFYIQTRYDGSVEERYPFLAYRAHDREQWQLLARTLCAYLDVTQFEGIDALLSAASPEERHRYLQYANAPSSSKAIEQKRLQLRDGHRRANHQFGKPKPVNNDPDSTAVPGTDERTMEGSDTADDESESSDSTTSSEQHSPSQQLYDESDLRIANQTITIEPEPVAESSNNGSGIDADMKDELRDPADDHDDVLNQTASTSGNRNQSQYDVEDLGMALAEAYEATRLRDDYDCQNPEAYVFRVDERHLVEEARSGKGKTALNILMDEAGIPKHFPGFDLLTVHPKTLEPDRLIELKAATCRRRKPSVSWNEWTTARNEWVQTRERPLYYLYVIGHLSKTTSSDPYIRTIANPYRLLDAQVENDIEVTQSIQVDIDGFTEEGLEAVSSADPVIEIPVETDVNPN